jgi:hypothetical protein
MLVAGPDSHAWADRHELMAYWTRGGTGRLILHHQQQGNDDENIKQLLNLSTIFVVDVKVVLYL